MIEGLSHITFIVKDLDRTSNFLKTVFEAKEVYSSSDKTFSYSKEKILLVNGLWFAIMEGEPLSEKTYNHIALKVSETDLEKYIERVKVLGLEILDDRNRIGGEGKSFYFYDYDNHLFELHTGTLEERLEVYKAASAERLFGAKEMKSDVFNQKARDYALYRLQYADEAIEYLIDITGMDSTWNVADIGSGTGNVSRHLVEKVNLVFAVEPEEAMRYQAELLLGKYPSFKSIAATAERSSLQENSIDLITVGQAFQWIDWKLALKEFDRILRYDGWIALLWNQYETTPDMDMDFVFKPGTQFRKSFPVDFEEEWEEYIGGIRSASRNPSPGDEGYEEFEEKLRKRFNSQAVNERITVKYTTKLAVGRLNQRTGK